MKREYALGIKAAYPGSTLIVTVCVLLTMIGFLGIGVFVGLQAYLQSELQKAANAAALVGASEMYQGSNSSVPSLNAATGRQAATDTFNAILQNSPALRGFSAQISSGPTIDAARDTITLDVAGMIPTSFLAPLGIRQIEMTVHSKAQALQLRPTDLPNQRIYIRASGHPNLDTGSAFQRTVTNFPIVNRNGNDIYLRQGSIRKPFQVEACTETDCYDLGSAASAAGGGSPWPNPNNKSIVEGNVLIDMGRAGVNKATSLKISHSGRYYTKVHDKRFVNTRSDDVTLDSISIFGYAALCPSDKNCDTVPLGYARY